MFNNDLTNNWLVSTFVGKNGASVDPTLAHLKLLRDQNCSRFDSLALGEYDFCLFIGLNIIFVLAYYFLIMHQ